MKVGDVICVADFHDLCLAVFFLFLYAKNIFRKSRKLFGSLQF